MRIPMLVAGLLVLAACSDEGGTGPVIEEPIPELPRPAVQLLVERWAHGQKAWYTMSPDGSWVLPFPNIPADAEEVVPSPDGRSLAIRRLTASGDIHLWLMDRDGRNLRPLMEGDRVVWHVSWSPDGSRLALSVSDGAINGDLFVIDADGTDLVHLTPDPLPAVVFDRQPSWSPDGQRLVFVSSRTGPAELWTMPAAGGEPQQVFANLDGIEDSPSYSPDGQWIAFEVLTGDSIGIGLVRPNGMDYRILRQPGEAARPAWTPDGRVLFSSPHTGDWEVYAVDPASGAAATNLTRHRDHDLAARPLPWVAPATEWLGFDGPQRTATGGSDLLALVAGDVTGDRRPDLVALSGSDQSLRTLVNTGTGFVTRGPVLPGVPVRDLALADVSLDGIADILALGPAAFQVWRGGAAGFTPPTSHALQGEGRAFAIADFDRDGSPDIGAVFGRAGEPFHVLVHGVRVPDSALVAIIDLPVTAAAPLAACAADATGEGASDLVVVTLSPAAPLVLVPGRGDISFIETLTPPTGLVVDPGVQVRCGDVDGDRRADLLLLGQAGGGSLTLLRATGNGFAVPVRRAIAAADLALGDMDQDGDPDLFLVQPDRGTVAVLRNAGDGRFAPPLLLPIGGRPQRIAAADFTGDGWLDLAVADADGTVAVLANRRR